VNGDTIALRVEDGHEVWRIQLIPGASHQSCAAMLPLSSRQDKVFCCSASGGWMIALDGATGKQLWKSSVHDKRCVYPGVMLGPRASVLAATQGGRTIATDKEPHLLSFDDLTGVQRWNTSLLSKPSQKFATVAGAAMSQDQTTVVAVQMGTPAVTIDALTGKILASGGGGGIPNPGWSPIGSYASEDLSILTPTTTREHSPSPVRSRMLRSASRHMM
jgi:outer membrane protein assembly factor BamB